MSEMRQQPIEPSPLSPVPQPAPALSPVPPKPAIVAQPEEPLWEEVRDSWRETFETVSFVVFLVLMLKAFVAEAYVIPTGSMATTLLGDHMHLQCPRCQQKYTVNASNGGQNLDQVQDEGGRKLLRFEGCCPNCQYVVSNPTEGVDGGDKVLVLKPVYDMFAPERHETVVFKYPQGPQKDFGAYNYIKRLWGLPGEKLAIFGGDVYLVDEAGKLNIIRKPPDKLLRMRRIVNDNELLNPTHPQPLNTAWKPATERWEAPPADQNAWASTEQGKQWNSKPVADTMSWLRYQHRFKPTSIGGDAINRGFAGGQEPVDGPHLITNFLAYNHSDRGMMPHDWVGDLMVDAEVDVQAAQGTFVLQLKKGVLSAEASFDLQTGKCTVTLQKEGKHVSSHEADAGVKTGKHLLRFANFDNRLTVWVGSKLLFGHGIDYADVSDAERGPRLADLLPASLGTQNASLTVRKLSIWRDIYYSRDARAFDAEVGRGALGVTADEFQMLAKQGNIHSVQRHEWLPYYPEVVQLKNMSGQMGKPRIYPTVDPTHPSDRFGPDEYFMLGDNSLASQDSRDWGQVPRRMLLGRAIWVYWPYRNFQSIR